MITISDEISLSTILAIETKSLKATLDIQKNLNKQILTFMKNFIGKLEITIDFNPTNKLFKYLNDSTTALNQSNENIQTLQKLLTQLQKIEKGSKKDVLSDSMKEKIEEYNSEFTDKIDVIYKNTNNIEKFIHKISKIDLPKLLAEFNKKEKISKQEENDSITISSDELNSSFIENTLVISETQGKVILPYKLADIKDILLDNPDKYTSIEDVIQKLFTKPISNYKIPSLARFKETYKLMVEKEKSSKIQALSLASELFSNFNLHPAIITACNSLDELDIYLACLEDNTLEDFHFFDIKYEIPPAIVKVKS